MNEACWSIVAGHYKRDEVVGEIVDYSRNRWVAVHCASGGKEQLLFRYNPKSKQPLAVLSRSDFEGILRLLSSFKPRSFYASIAVYKKPLDGYNVFDLDNFASCSPVWDIDSRVGSWRKTVEVARELVSFVESKGVQKSVFLKWSGNGIHVHIHHEAFSKELLERIHPLDVAWAVVEYVRSKLYEKLGEDQLLKYGLKVENKIDRSRIFTAPLSLHRKLNLVCICLKPNQLDEFHISWASLSGFRHNKAWRDHEVGEADALAEEAYKAVGGCPYIGASYRRRRRRERMYELIEEIQRIAEEVEGE